MSEEKKIIVDEDWKSQVEAEQEAARSGETEKASAEEQSMEMPPASLLALCEMLQMQFVLCMGLAPNPATGEVHQDLVVAKHMLDTLGMLHEKTEGNRTEEEDEIFGQMLHQLRMLYLQVQQQPAEGSESPIIEE